MNDKRTMIWLFLAAVFTIAANAFLSYRRPMVAPMQDRVILSPSFVASRIEIMRPGEPKTILEKDSQWKLISPFPSSVDAPVVLRMLDAFATMTVEDSLTDGELLKLGRTRDDFGLVEPRLTVSLIDNKGRRTDVSFGNATPSAGGVYVGKGDSGLVMVFPMPLFEAANLSADVLRERVVFGNASDFIIGFNLKRPGEAQIPFVRENELWKFGGEVASKEKIDELLALIVDARANTFVWPVVATNRGNVASSALLSGYGLDSDTALSVNLRCRDGIDRRIVFGHDAGASEVYALIHNGAAIVTLDHQIKDVLTQDMKLFTDSRLFPFEESSVTSFTLFDGETNYVVARDGLNKWRLDSPISAPADNEVAELLLRRLLTLKSADQSADGIRVSVSNTANGYTVSRAAVLAEIRPEDLRDKDILQIDASLVRRIVSGSSVAYSRDRHVWTIESIDKRDCSVDQLAVDAVLLALAPLRAEYIVTLKASSEDLVRYGLESPYHTVAVDQDRVGSVRRNILIGTQTIGGGRYATVGSTEAVFILPAKTVSVLVSPLVLDSRK